MDFRHCGKFPETSGFRCRYDPDELAARTSMDAGGLQHRRIMGNVPEVATYVPVPRKAEWASLALALVSERLRSPRGPARP